jgi:hypothetical protein
MYTGPSSAPPCRRHLASQRGIQEASIAGRVKGVNDGVLESRVFHLSLASWVTGI